MTFKKIATALLVGFLSLTSIPDSDAQTARLRARGKPVVVQPPDPVDDTVVFLDTVTSTGTNGNGTGHVPDTGDRWEIDGNSFHVTDGSHTIVARACDWGGRCTNSSTITVTVDNDEPYAESTVEWLDLGPSSGSGTYTVVKNLEGTPDVDSVQFMVDGSNYGSPDSSEPYSVFVDTTMLSNGPHYIVARATSSTKTTSDSYPLQFYVRNSGFPANPGNPDTGSPTVNITSPTNGSTVSGLVNLTVDASDDNAVRYVHYIIDGHLINYESENAGIAISPYSYHWSTKTPLGIFKWAEFQSWMSPTGNTFPGRITYKAVPTDDFTDPDYYVQAMLRQTNVVSDGFVFLRARIDSAGTTYYGAGIYPRNQSGNDCYLFKVIAGTPTTLGTPANCDFYANLGEQEQLWKFSVVDGASGPVLTMHKDGTQVLQATDTASSITTAGSCGFGAGRILSTGPNDRYDGSLALDSFTCVQFGTGVVVTPVDPTITIVTPQAGGTYNTTASTLTVTGTATAGSGSLSGITWANAATGGSGNAAGLGNWSVTGSSALTVADDQFTTASSTSLDDRTATPTTGTWNELTNTTGGSNYIHVNAAGYAGPLSSSSAGDVQLAYVLTPATAITAQNYDVNVAMKAVGTSTDAGLVIVGGNGTTTDFCGLVLLGPSASPDLYLIQMVAGTPTTLGSYNSDYAVGQNIEIEMRGSSIDVKVNGTSRITATDGDCDNDNEVGIGAGSFRGATGTTTYASDLFTGSDGTNLVAHTANTGGAGWVEAEDTATTTISINSNRAYPPAEVGNARIIYTFSPSTPLPNANYSVAITSTNFLDANAWACVGGRFTDSSNYYAGCWTHSTGNPDVKLVKKVAGSWTTLGTADCAPVSGNIWTLTMSGTSISFGKGGSCVISVTDSSLSSTGLPFIGFGNVTGTSTDDVTPYMAVDSFTVTAGAGGDTLSTSTQFEYVTVVDQDAAGTGIPINNGSNLLTFTATNTLGRTKTATLTVVRGASDTTSPTATITTPTPNATHATTNASIVIGGTAADNIAVTGVTWECTTTTCTPDNGTASGTTSWNFSTTLACSSMGTANTIVVTPADAAGNTPVTDTIIVTCTSGDAVNPVITITTNSGNNFSTTGTTASVAGTASDAGGLASITWICDTGSQGTATGTTSWTSTVALAVGANICTFTATDLAGNVATDSITITRSTTLAITTTTMVGATQNSAYSQIVAATGGTLPYTFDNNSGGSSLGGGACTGLSITTTSGGASGTISGTPTTTGTCNLTAKVTDNIAATDTQALSIVVSAAGAEGPHDYFDDVILGSPNYVLGYSARPIVGHNTNTDPYYTSQLTAFSGGSVRVPTYNYAGDTNPEKQDAAKFVIPQWAVRGTTTATINASSADALDYVSLSLTHNQNAGVRVDSEVMRVSNDTRQFQIINATTGVNPAVLTLAQPFIDEVTGTTFVSGFKKTVKIPNASPALDTTFTITVIDATHVSIPTTIKSVTNYTGAIMYYGADVTKTRVRRGQFGTTAASHTSGTTAYTSINSLETQWHLGTPGGGNTHYWSAQNGFKHLWTWDTYYTSSFLGTLLTNYKAFQFEDRGSGLFIEPNVNFTGGQGTANCGMTPATDIGGYQTRMYLGVGGVSPWTTAQNGLAGPGVTQTAPLQPVAATFCYKPSVWVRYWVLLDQRANDWDYLTIWIADENRGPTKVTDAQPISVRICSSPSSDCNGTNWSETINRFKVEMNTSSDLVSRADGRDLVFYFRNWGFLSIPSSTSTATIESDYITGRRPIR